MENELTNNFRFNVNDRLHRVLMIDAAVRGVRAKKLASQAVLDFVEQGCPSAGIPLEAILTGSRPVLARFSPDETGRIESFARRHNLCVTQVARVALAVKYAPVVKDTP